MQLYSKIFWCRIKAVLSGNCIATKIVGKSIAKVKILYHQAKHFDMGTRKTIVSTLIQCRLSKRNKNRLQTAQNKLILFILQLSARVHRGPECCRKECPSYN